MVGDSCSPTPGLHQLVVSSPYLTCRHMPWLPSPPADWGKCYEGWFEPYCQKTW